MSSVTSPAPPVQLRTGDQTDLDSVMEVMRDAFDAGFGEGWSRSQCAGILPLSGVVLTIARDEQGHVCGFSLQRNVAGESELLLLAVDRSTRRRGIGRQLLDHFIDRGRDDGMTKLHLEVRDGNPATTMYQAFGFTPAGRRTNYYRGSDGRLFDAITMVLDLDCMNSRHLLTRCCALTLLGLGDCWIAIEAGRVRVEIQLGEINECPMKPTTIL